MVENDSDSSMTQLEKAKEQLSELEQSLKEIITDKRTSKWNKVDVQKFGDVIYYLGGGYAQGLDKKLFLDSIEEAQKNLRLHPADSSDENLHDILASLVELIPRIQKAIVLKASYGDVEDLLSRKSRLESRAENILAGAKILTGVIEAFSGITFEAFIAFSTAKVSTKGNAEQAKILKRLKVISQVLSTSQNEEDKGAGIADQMKRVEFFKRKLSEAKAATNSLSESSSTIAALLVQEKIIAPVQRTLEFLQKFLAEGEKALGPACRPIQEKIVFLRDYCANAPFKHFLGKCDESYKDHLDDFVTISGKGLILSEKTEVIDKVFSDIRLFVEMLDKIPAHVEKCCSDADSFANPLYIGVKMRSEYYFGSIIRMIIHFFFCPPLTPEMIAKVIETCPCLPTDQSKRAKDLRSKKDLGHHVNSHAAPFRGTKSYKQVVNIFEESVMMYSNAMLQEIEKLEGINGSGGTVTLGAFRRSIAKHAKKLAGG